MFRTLFNSLKDRSARAPARQARRDDARRRSAAARLRVEALEDRTLPSTFTVTNLLDTGADSLRAAITAANANPGADTIDFGVTGSIGLTSGQLDITDSLTINGPGAAALTVSGNHVSRVFSVSGGTTVSIAGLTMTDGLANGSSPVLASNGGAILNYGLSLIHI